MFCRCCLKDGNKTLFNKAGKASDGTQKYSIYCKVCLKEKSHKYYLNNKDAISKRTALWKKNNPEKAKVIWTRAYYKNPSIKIQATREWQRNNPEKVRVTSNRTTRKYRRTVSGKMNHNISGSIYKSLTRNKNGYHWEDILGYTIEQLKRHIESLFTVGMTWEKYMNGEIHIDHIIPISFFKFNNFNDTEFRYCWSLGNLQPLWSKENLMKSNKIKEVA